MPALRTAIDGSVWEALGGSSRKFRNLLSGETISRRQYDERYGTLARQGFRTYEAKAKASPPELRSSRPAIGRPSAKNKPSQFASIKPLTERKSREVSIPFYAFYEEDEGLSDVEDYRDSYEAAVRGFIRNSRIFAVALRCSVRTRGGGRVITFRRLTVPDSLPDFDKMLSELIEYLYDGDETQTLNFHILFKQSAIPQSRRKQHMAELSRLKAQREAVKRRKRKAGSK